MTLPESVYRDLDAQLAPVDAVLRARPRAAVSAIGLWRWKPARQRASARKTSAPALSGATQVQSGS